MIAVLPEGYVFSAIIVEDVESLTFLSSHYDDSGAVTTFNKLYSTLCVVVQYTHYTRL